MNINSLFLKFLLKDKGGHNFCSGCGGDIILHSLAADVEVRVCLNM